MVNLRTGYANSNGAFFQIRLRQNTPYSFLKVKNAAYHLRNRLQWFWFAPFRVIAPKHTKNKRCRDYTHGRQKMEIGDIQEIGQEIGGR